MLRRAHDLFARDQSGHRAGEERESQLAEEDEEGDLAGAGGDSAREGLDLAGAGQDPTGSSRRGMGGEVRCGWDRGRMRLGLGVCRGGRFLYVILGRGEPLGQARPRGRGSRWAYFTLN